MGLSFALGFPLASFKIRTVWFEEFSDFTLTGPGSDSPSFQGGFSQFVIKLSYNITLLPADVIIQHKLMSFKHFLKMEALELK